MHRHALAHTLEKIAMFKAFKGLTKHPLLRDAKLVATGAGTMGAAWLGDKQYNAMKRLYAQGVPQVPQQNNADEAPINIEPPKGAVK